jgi:hypothetical protein
MCTPFAEGEMQMLPDVNHPVWRQVVTEEKAVQSSKATINLFLQSSKMSYGRDQSPANVNQLIARLHCFLAHYESMFSSEIEQILQ